MTYHKRHWTLNPEVREITIKKMSLAKLGNRNPMRKPEIAKKISEANKGRKWKESSKKKLSLTKKGKPRSLETKLKISKGLKNHPCYKNPLRNIKISQALLKNPIKYWLGKKRLSMTGNKNWNWKGGFNEPYTIDWTNSLRIAIRERDKYTCQICGTKQGDFAFDIHHIDYNKKNCNPNNLITLCRSCHTKTTHNRKWEKQLSSAKR